MPKEKSLHEIIKCNIFISVSAKTLFFTTVAFSRRTFFPLKIKSSGLAWTKLSSTNFQCLLQISFLPPTLSNWKKTFGQTTTKSKWADLDSINWLNFAKKKEKKAENNFLEEIVCFLFFVFWWPLNFLLLLLRGQNWTKTRSR